MTPEQWAILFGVTLTLGIEVFVVGVTLVFMRFGRASERR